MCIHSSFLDLEQLSLLFLFPLLNSKDLYIKTSTGLIPWIHSLQRSVYERQRAEPQASTLKRFTVHDIQLALFLLNKIICYMSSLYSSTLTTSCVVFNQWQATCNVLATETCNNSRGSSSRSVCTEELENHESTCNKITAEFYQKKKCRYIQVTVKAW